MSVRLRLVRSVALAAVRPETGSATALLVEKGRLVDGKRVDDLHVRDPHEGARGPTSVPDQKIEIRGGKLVEVDGAPPENHLNNFDVASFATYPSQVASHPSPFR
jgi:hypothetical protein